MRIWLVDIAELSDQHLLGQHRELHMLFSMLNLPRFTNHRMVSFYRDKKGWLCNFHKQLAEEISYRFGTPLKDHKTPLKKTYTSGKAWEPPEEWVEFDQVDLARRYQSETRFAYRWTRRPRPDWADNKRALWANLGEIPAHTAGAKIVGAKSEQRA